MITEKKLMTVKQLAEKLSVSEQSIYRSVQAGLIPHVRILRGCLRFDPQKIDEWLNNNFIDSHR